MSLFDIGAVILLVSIMADFVQTFSATRKTWVMDAIDIASVIGILMMLFFGSRAIIEWWPT